MKASRLKTIVIVILLLVNAFLLFLLLSRRAEQTQAYERTVEQLCVPFERSGVSCDRVLLPKDSDMYSVSLERDSARETAFAEALLGDDISVLDSGGGVSRYSGELGSCSIRSGGAVETAPFSLTSTRAAAPVGSSRSARSCAFLTIAASRVPYVQRSPDSTAAIFCNPLPPLRCASSPCGASQQT